ncbi:pentapeptide repeat-containing protein, partial [Nostoc sp. NMS1]|uniref:pentapeptide repeat-containing protein n=1 Tax=Nostoc sp. NMS1 TaxID=2815388 RepID=UPI0025CE43A4
MPSPIKAFRFGNVPHSCRKCCIEKPIRINQLWQTVDAARGKEYSQARIQALEKLVQAGENLAKKDFSNANLSGANLSSADLSGAILIGADLSNAFIVIANFSSADLRYANLSGLNQQFQIQILTTGTVYLEDE